MQKFYKIPDNVGAMADIIGNNSAKFSKADPVTIDSAGNLIVATSSGEKILGFCLEDVTMDSDNETVDKYKPSYIPAYPGVLMVYDSDQDAVLADDIGEYADVTGTTGAIYMNLTAGSTGQFLVRSKDPYEEGDDSVVVVEAAEPQTFAFAQS